MKKRILAALLAAVILVLSCSCGRKEDEAYFKVVTSFYPVYVSAANIIGDIEGVSLKNLTEPDTGCLHDYALTTADLKNLDGAGLFILNGLGMESFAGKVAYGVRGMTTLDCGKYIENILESKTGEENPHYWMSIDNTIAQCEKIASKLSELDPVHEAEYMANKDEYVRKLTELKTEAEARVAALSEKELVVFHESFDYFADEFGLSVASVISGHNGGAPSASKLAATVDYMKENDIDAVFTEKQFPADVAETVAREADAEVYFLEVLTSGKINSETKDAYINAVKYNLGVLEEALG